MARFAGEWRAERRFAPKISARERKGGYEAWRAAVARTLTRREAGSRRGGR
jgi:glycerol kinase